MAIYSVVVNVMGFINQFCTPIALKNIQYKYVFVRSKDSNFDSLYILLMSLDLCRMGPSGDSYLVPFRRRDLREDTRRAGGRFQFTVSASSEVEGACCD